MTTRFEWIKLILDRWTIIVPMLMFLGSAVGWTFTGIESAEKDELTKAMKDQIEILVDYDPKPRDKKTISCNCEAIARKLIKQHAARHKEDL